MEGLYPSKIAKILNCNKRQISYYLRKFENLGLIILYSKYPKLYELTDDGKEMLQSSRYISDKQIRLENYQIKIPIVVDNPNIQVYDKVNEMFTNWIPKYIKLDFPYILTLEKTPQNIIVWIKGQKFPKDKSYFLNLGILTAQVLMFVKEFFRYKYNIVIDITKANVIGMEQANDISELDEEIQPSTKFTLNLNRKSETILGTSEMDAKAWIDRSQGPAEVESNDLSYEEKLILMPERVEHMFIKNRQRDEETRNILNEYSKQIALHLEVQQKTKETLDIQQKTLEIQQNTLQAIQESLKKPSLIDKIKKVFL